MNATKFDKIEWLGGFTVLQAWKIAQLADAIISDLNRLSIDPDEERVYQLARRLLEVRHYNMDGAFLTWSRDFIEDRHGF